MANILRGLPQEIIKKINKTKQTRGAQPYDRVVYQNRVNRNGIAVVPYAFRKQLPKEGFENGYVIMLRPRDYFASPGVARNDLDTQVQVGDNAFVYYDNRRSYSQFPPLPSWRPRKRGGPGEVVYRMPATTATNSAQGAKIVDGEPQGIRFFEYAPADEIYKACIQLALLAWRTAGIEEVRVGDMPDELYEEAERFELWNVERLERLGVLYSNKAICPLCRKPIQATEMMSRVQQAEGREVFDLTITEVNLFHMEDLRPGAYNHRSYMLGWGHHHCNAVARDHGLERTLNWMADVLRRNGYAVEKTVAAQKQVVAMKEAGQPEGEEENR